MRSTTAAVSESGATRSASSHRLSPSFTCTTFVVDGTDGATDEARVPRPTTAANATVATTNTQTGESRGSGASQGRRASTRGAPATRRRVGGRPGTPRRTRRAVRGSSTGVSTSDLCLTTDLCVTTLMELPPDHSSNTCSKVEQSFDRTFVRFSTTGHRQKTRPVRRVVEQVFDLLVTYG